MNEIYEFNYVSSLGDNFYISCVENNLKSFLDYGFLNIGAFVNVDMPTSGLYGQSFHTLKNSVDPGHQNNRVWQTPKKDWVWESGIVYNSISPTPISGLFVNNSYYPAPSGSGSITYSLDYTNGRAIFNSSVSASSKVEMAYSYRWCQVTTASSSQGVKYLQQFTYEPNRSINTNNKGDNAIVANARLQMPAIVIETIPKNKDTPFELGSFVSLREQDILLHIYTENINDLNIIMDILRLQKEKTLQLYNIKSVVSNQKYGLNADGSKNINGLSYKDILLDSNLLWHRMYIKDMSFVDIQKNNISSLFWCICRLTSEIIF